MGAPTMAEAGNAYSFSLTTFSPSGKLVQIEHALAAVNQGTTALGIKATNGIVVATSAKPASPLVCATPHLTSKVTQICPNIGVVYAGMGPDYRVLVVMQDATQSGGV